MSGIDQEWVKKSGNKFQGTYCAYELLKGGQLYEFLNETGPFDEYTARFIFHQIIDVLEYLSSIGISHSKICLESIMLDDNFNIKIRNFQKATIGTTSVSSNLVGSYYAPEVINNSKFTCQIADIFSAGVLLFALVSQANPFYKADSKDPYFKYISNNRLDLFWKIFERSKQSEDYYTKEFKELINWMLSPDPHERPSLSEIKESEWYNKEVPTNEEIIKEFTKRK